MRITMEPQTRRLHYCVAIKTLLFAQVLLLSSMASAQEPVAVLTPLHYTAYLGQPAVKFHCSATNASDIGWLINGRFIGSNIEDLNTRGISTSASAETNSINESTLTITSIVNNSNTRILCVAHHLVELRYIPTDEAVFQVQGTLEECRGLQITSHGTYHKSLTWDPPPSLNITIVDPDISGYVVCDSIRTQCTHIDMREAGGDSHNFLQYKFPNLRTHINFTVTAVNIVGDGKNTSMVYEPCENTDETVPAPERFDAQSLSAVVSFDSESTPIVTLTVMSQRRCFDVYVVRLEPVELETGSGRSGLHELIESELIIPSVDVSGDGNGRLTLNVTTNSTLGINMFYKATLITTMDMMEAGSIQLSTYDLQDAKIRGGAENISIQCVFGSWSPARGCHVKIRNTAIQINMTRSGNQTAEEIVTGLSPGSYEVLIFDWEEDGSIATTPSHQDHIQVTGPPVDSSTPTPVPTTAATDTPSVVGIDLTQPTSLSVEYIAAIGGGGLGILVLLVLVIVMFVLVCKCRRRQPLPEEPEKDFKEPIYELPTSFQKPLRIERLDSKAPLLDCSPTTPLYDLPSLPITPTSPTFSVADGGSGMPQPQSPDGIHMYDTADRSVRVAVMRRQSGATSPSQASSGSAPETQTQDNVYTGLIESEDTSSHTYTKPSKKRSVRKPVTASPSHRTTTDGDSGRGTMSPDQHLPGESDRTPPLPPRNYVNYEFDIPPPMMQLRASTSADKLGSTKPARQCNSCIILPGPSTTDVQPCTLPQSTDHNYFSLQHLPGISVLPVSSDQYSQKQDAQSIERIVDGCTGHIYQVLQRQPAVVSPALSLDSNCYFHLQDSTSDIADQSGQLSPGTGDTKANTISPSKTNLQETFQDQEVPCEQEHS